MSPIAPQPRTSVLSIEHQWWHSGTDGPTLANHGKKRQDWIEFNGVFNHLWRQIFHRWVLNTKRSKFWHTDFSKQPWGGALTCAERQRSGNVSNRELPDLLKRHVSLMAHQNQTEICWVYPCPKTAVEFFQPIKWSQIYIYIYHCPTNSGLFFLIWGPFLTGVCWDWG